MVFDIEYKAGDTDNVGVILYENGIGVDLTGYVVNFVMKMDNIRYDVVCSEGSTVNGLKIPFSEGGVTMEFNDQSTSTAGIFNGEFVVTRGYNTNIRFPSGNNYITVKIWEAI